MLKEVYSLDGVGMQVWWHGTTDEDFNEIYAPSFENPFFISDDPSEAEMYMHGDWSVDSSRSKLALIVLKPSAINIFDWCSKDDLALIPSIPSFIKEMLAKKRRSTFSLVSGMCEMGLFESLGNDDFDEFASDFQWWLDKTGVNAKPDRESIKDVYEWLSSARSSRDLFHCRDLSEEIDCDKANRVLYELFWSELEGTEFNAFHEVETSENIALCNASAIEGIWSRTLTMNEATQLLKQLRNAKYDDYNALRNAKSAKEAEAALKKLLSLLK